MKYTILILLIAFLSQTGNVAAQEINFGIYSDYNLDVSELNSGSLNFGLTISGEGTKSIDIGNAKIIAITGVKNLDVFVDITVPQYLVLNGNPANSGDPVKSIPLTLQVAYDNVGDGENIAQARFVNVTGTSVTLRFPIQRRVNGPPGPPPTPAHKGYTPPEATAYLYLYGSINVGDVNAGEYSGLINVNVSYDSL